MGDYHLKLFLPFVGRGKSMNMQDRYYLFLNQFKNNDELLINICRHVVQAILITTFNGYAHGNISL